jgi:A/G-specific adenine glycosylase
MTPKEISSFQSHIRKRRATNRRDLPWRKTTDPYKIWISETMLCQTQVSRVITYFNNWMKLFPTVEILAQATNTEVLSARSGLGYNSRGLRVKQAAEKIVNISVIARNEAIHNSQDIDCHVVVPPSRNDTPFPTTYEDLIALPGVGDYVANAILAFAYNEDVSVIDTNIRRILIHQFDLDEKTSLKDLKIVALEILPRGYAREWYNALMDYGALELTAKRSGIRPTTRQSKFE